MTEDQFASVFAKLTGNPPFPWQWDLYSRWFAQGRFPQSCNIPTGLGKTSVVAIWLIALANHRNNVPRRLVYVVNRRTVVDQTTDEAEKLRDNLRDAGMFDDLASLCALPLESDQSPLAISTLRGQFADNLEWSADPARPAVIIGTVDMIGSRLLFSGYGVGFKRKPLHAGFLGQDSLLIHDEAHLEPAFQNLLAAVAAEQGRCGEFRTLYVTELTATSRGEDGDFGLTDAEKEGRIPEVNRRLRAKKTLRLHPLDDDKKVADRVAELALAHRDSGQAILVFARRIDDIEKIAKKLPSDRTCLLTGTVRGLERENLIRNDVFIRFLPVSNRPDGIPPKAGVVWLVCTSAGEVGINISADHMVSDLVHFDSAAQRFGRVNRFGEGEAIIDIVHPTKFADDDFDGRLKSTLMILGRLNGDASPGSLAEVPTGERQDAFTPEPDIFQTSEILFDAWSFTTIKGPLPGRPAVGDYLHGRAEWEPPETYVAWRREVEIVVGELLEQYPPDELLGEYPLKPHELLRDRYDRVFKHLERLAERNPDAPVWMLTAEKSQISEEYLQVMTLKVLVSRGKDALANTTVLLPPSVGGLTAGGTLGNEEGRSGLDVADEWYTDGDGRKHRRVRVFDDEPDISEKTAGMRLIRSIFIAGAVGGELSEESDDQVVREWRWYVVPRSADDDGSTFASRQQALKTHNAGVGVTAVRIASALGLKQELITAIGFAAARHDDGKDRRVWQLSIGNRGPTPLAKSGNRRPPDIKISYRHELGSLVDVSNAAEFRRLSADAQDLVLHLIAAHHGRARPHFPPNEIIDPERSDALVTQAAAEVPRRFARLQRRYGRWGLAYLESLLRAADAYASAHPTEDNA